MNVGRTLLPFLPLAIPLASRWVKRQQAAIMRNGTKLTPEQMNDARRVGVRHPERIRLSFVPSIPIPANRVFNLFGDRETLLGRHTAGLTLNYGILIREEHRHSRQLCIHECVHVGQYERLGSIEAFLRAYLRECLDPGYPFGPLEQEAIERTRRLLQGN